MKLKTLGTLSCLLLAAVLAVPPPTAQANVFDDLLQCTGDYMYGLQDVWNTWYASPQSQNDLADRNWGLDNLFYNYQACNSLVNVDTAQYDFCTGAAAAAQQCSVSFSDNFNAWAECRRATRVDECQ